MNVQILHIAGNVMWIGAVALTFVAHKLPWAETDWKATAFLVAVMGFLALPGQVLAGWSTFWLGVSAAWIGYPILRLEYIPALMKWRARKNAVGGNDERGTD